MPITSSAKKALRQNVRKKKANARVRIKVRDLQKQTRTLVAQNNKEAAQKLLSQLYKTLDKAAKVGVLTKNTASRKKSRLTALVQKQSSAKA